MVTKVLIENKDLKGVSELAHVGIWGENIIGIETASAKAPRQGEPM